MVTGFFKEDVRPWEGGIMTSVVNTFENEDNKGHGVKLEPTCMVVSQLFIVVPLILTKAKRSNIIISPSTLCSS